MRFLIGIFTGAVVTLLVATAMDAPTHPILSNAKDLAATGWDRLIHATSSSLFEPTQKPTAGEAQMETTAAPEAAPETTSATPSEAESAPDGESEAGLHRRADEPFDEQAAYAAPRRCRPGTRSGTTGPGARCPITVL